MRDKKRSILPGLLASGGWLWVCAFVLRLLVASHYRTGTLAADSDGMLEEFAWNMLRGRGYVIYQDGISPHMPSYALLPPLYPWIVFIYLKTVGAHFFGLRVLFCAFGALTCVLTSRLAEKLMGPPGRWAGWLLCFYPGHIVWSTRLMVESAIILSLTSAVLLALQARERNSALAAFGSGVCLAICTLGRGEFLLVSILFAAWFLWKNEVRRSWKLSASLLLSFSLGMSPWVIRNSLHFHRLVITATNYGENFYFAHCPEYRFGGFSFPLPNDVLERMLQQKPLDEIIVAETYLKTGKAYCRRFPGIFVLTTIINFLMFWRPNLTWGYIPLKENIFYIMGAFPLLVFFFYGVQSILRTKRHEQWDLILAIVIYKMLIHLPFYVTVRFRETLSPLLIVVAMFGFWSWLKAVQNPSRSRHPLLC